MTKIIVRIFAVPMILILLILGWPMFLVFSSDDDEWIVITGAIGGEFFWILILFAAVKLLGW